MSKISAYPENTAPAPEIFTPIEPVVHDQKYKTPIGNLSVIPFRNKMNKQWNEFDGGINNQLSPFTPTAIGAGTFVPLVQEANHPGIWRISSAAAANTGYVVSLGGITSVSISGGETAEFIMRFPTTTGLVAVLGFNDSDAIGNATDGAYCQSVGTVFSGVCRNNGGTTQTSTTFTVVANTWYRCKTEINSNATRVDFFLYDASGNLLWTDFLTTGIPTGVGRETGFAAKAYKTSAGAADLVDLDWMAYYNTKALVR